MERARRFTDRFLDSVLPWLVLAILLTYTYARLLAVPYKGLDFGAGGRIIAVFVDGGDLRVGDQLEQVGDLTWERYRADDTTVLFAGLLPGEAVNVIVRRSGETVAVTWTYPGLNAPELLRYAISGIWLAYFFWAVGVIIGMNLRPKGEHRAIGLAFSYLLALGLLLGGESRVWYGARLFLFIFFLGVPLALHFHWVWPRPLGRLAPPVLWAAYAGALVLAIAALLGKLPLTVFYAGLLVGVIGSLLLLVLHAVSQSEQRPGLGRLAIMGIVAMLPQAAYPILSERLSAGMTELVTAAGLPLLTIAYATAAYRRQIKGVELRLNSLITAYVFLVILGVLILPIVTLAAFHTPDGLFTLLIASFAGMLTALGAMFFYPGFKSFVNRRLLGIFPRGDELVHAYMSRITVAPSIPRLVGLVRDELLPTLRVRKFLFLRLDQEKPRILLAAGISRRDIPVAEDLPLLLALERRPGSTIPHVPARYDWVRLVMALRVEQERLGVWLLGARDPDDDYVEQEVVLIRALADQTAIALSHCLQTERLRELYQANIARTEEERQQLARALHDNVLNQLAGLLMKLEDPSVTPGVLKSFEAFSDRVRGIVTELRPPMLAYGLRPALEELTETLAETAGKPVNFDLEALTGTARYPEKVELHLFRIVQESCANAVRHADPARVAISGRLSPDEVAICVEDDGCGFDAPDAAALGRLVTQKHFGLAGMVERANLIGGGISIVSAHGRGTRVVLSWRARPTGALPGMDT